MDAKWLDRLGMVARHQFLGNAYSGNVPGKWDDLSDDFRTAWRGVAEAVLRESGLLQDYGQKWADFAPWETSVFWVGADVDASIPAF